MSTTSKILVTILIALAPFSMNIVSATEIDYIKSICTGCHGADGIAKQGIIPNLAGQREKYLAKQFRDFRKSAGNSTTQKEELTDIGGKRRHPIMSTITTRLSDDQIEELSRYYASLPCGTKAEINQTKPIPKVIACRVCHDEKGTSHEPWVPKLSGQNKLYLINQIYALQISSMYKTVKGSDLRTHPLMEERVAKLSEIEIENLASYFASRICR